MGRWTQEYDDAARLPEGMTRVAYDADTAQYTFQDHTGVLYHAPPHTEYGPLTRVADISITRPEAFDTDGNKTQLFVEIDSPPPAATFQDFLPASAISSSSSSTPTSDERKNPKARFVSAVRKTGLPKMHGVVSNLRRSMTSAKKTGGMSGYRPMPEDDSHPRRAYRQQSHDSQPMPPLRNRLRRVPSELSIGSEVSDSKKGLAEPPASR
ncbi:hypothetical protein BDQ12DRAFT_694275 [Crucibulum laeve]|uniref:Uncharacterized protein n=1 Tax=Crucibulum laeve TaxID=68775 RepID=A0A5C3LEV3_9AGAR|nr:hypothetical protein BDQ12DRAFT_694275 [Crucibulum laeve]